MCGSWSSEASRHLEGMKPFSMQVPFKLTGTNPDGATLRYITSAVHTGLLVDRICFTLSVSIMTGSKFRI